MTSCLPSRAPLAILQADRVGEITWEDRVSQCAHSGQGGRTPPPASMTTLPVKTCCGWDFPHGPVVKNLPRKAGEAVSIPGQGS